jgi:hypothetical protein
MIGGLIRAQVYGPEGIIKFADDFFESEKEWHIINEAMDAVLIPFLPERGGDGGQHWQCGFGGDEGSGLLDYWLNEKIIELPDVVFEIDGITYTMVFQVEDHELLDNE